MQRDFALIVQGINSLLMYNLIKVSQLYCHLSKELLSLKQCFTGSSFRNSHLETFVEIDKSIMKPQSCEVQRKEASIKTQSIKGVIK